MKRLLLIALVVLFAATASAEKAVKKELPRQGSLSVSAGTGGAGNFGYEMPWGSDNEGSAPISGSVSRMGQDSWVMKVFNNSEDTYSVNLRVIQSSERNATLKTDSFSYTLKPGQNAERTLRAAPNSARGELRLDSWKKIGGKKKDKAEETAGTADVQAEE